MTLLHEPALTPGEAYERILVNGSGRCIDARGDIMPVQVERWLCEATDDDRVLFLDRCAGPTLDVGCGPGRLLTGLAARGVPALGIDISGVAVGKARAQGVPALRRDVFGSVPGTGHWHHLLLADGNIGIGGDPCRLLLRTAALVRPGGCVHVELSGRTGGVVGHRLRLHVGDRVSAPFGWASVAADAVAGLAERAGLVVVRLDRRGERWAATLSRPGGDGGVGPA